MACRAQRATYVRDLTDRSAVLLGLCSGRASFKRETGDIPLRYLITACGVLFCLRRYCESMPSSLSRTHFRVRLLMFSSLPTELSHGGE